MILSTRNNASFTRLRASADSFNGPAEKQQQAESPIEKLIPKPNGQAGRKTRIDRNGRTREGFNLCTEMRLDGLNDKKTYNEFRVSQSTTFRLILTTR